MSLVTEKSSARIHGTDLHRRETVNHNVEPEPQDCSRPFHSKIYDPHAYTKHKDETI